MNFNILLNMAIKLTKNKDNMHSLENIDETLKDLVNVNKEQLKKTMPLWQQRFFMAVQLILMFIGIVGIGVLVLPNYFQETVPDYAIDVTVTPDKIMKNERDDTEFKFTFTNVGKKNITNFRILDITFHRQEGDDFKEYQQLNDNLISCNLLEVGKSCVLTEKMYGCERCFDDKDKNVMFFIYVESHPPIDNQVVELTIY